MRKQSRNCTAVKVYSRLPYACCVGWYIDIRKTFFSPQGMMLGLEVYRLHMHLEMHVCRDSVHLHKLGGSIAHKVKWSDTKFKERYKKK